MSNIKRSMAACKDRRLEYEVRFLANEADRATLQGDALEGHGTNSGETKLGNGRWKS
jgi:hypothetical protein